MKSKLYGFTILGGCAVGMGLLAQGCGGVDPDAYQGPGYKGQFQRGTLTHEDGRSEKLYFLYVDGEKKYQLYFPKGPRIEPTDDVIVHGPREGDEIFVDSYQVLTPPEPELEAPKSYRVFIDGIIDPPPLVPPLKVLAVSMGGTDGKKVHDFMNNDPGGMKRYYSDASFGIWTLDVTGVGPYSGGCSGSAAKTAAKAAGIKVEDYNQFQAVCGSGGFGNDAKKTALRAGTPRGVYNPFSNAAFTCTVVNQEVGHNYGLAHAGFCSNGSPAPNFKSCSGFDEYGSVFTAMGKGCDSFNSWERIQMGWFGGCNLIVVKGSGTYEIGPLTSMCNGPQVLMLAAAPTGGFDRYYYIEYHKPYGADKLDGVLVYYAADPMKGGWTGGDNNDPENPYSILVDPTGGKSARDSVMKEGKSWKTPEGVDVKIVSLGETAKFDIKFTTDGGQGAECYLDGKKPLQDPKPVCKKQGGGTGGTAGTGGTGSGGGPTSGGSAGSSGSSGSSGTGATGGSTGGTGTGGTGGGAKGGTGGTEPTGGTSGTTGGGVGGSAGSSAGGKGGSTTGGGTGTGGTPGGTEGCGCRTAARPPGVSGSFAVLMAALGSLVRFRRKRRILS